MSWTLDVFAARAHLVILVWRLIGDSHDGHSTHGASGPDYTKTTRSLLLRHASAYTEHVRIWNMCVYGTL